MLQIRRPVWIFDKQKVYRTQKDVENNNTVQTQALNNQKVVVLFSFNQSEKLNEAEHSQLLKILAACKLKEEDVAFINVAFNQAASFSFLQSRYPVTAILIFGEIELSKNLALKKYRAYQIDGVQIVKGETLTKLLNSPPDKKALWEELKKVFNP